MADIYLHNVRDEDVALLHQFIIRKYLFEQGIIPPRQRISELRNEMLRGYIKKFADEERETTAAFVITEGEISILMTRLRKKHIETWLIPGDDQIILVVPRSEVEEVEKSLVNLPIKHRREY